MILYIICLCFQPPEDALFAHPRLFRACVPPGMHRFRGNIWDFDCRPQVMRTLGYPLGMQDRIPEITEARNIELGLGLQVFFLKLYCCFFSFSFLSEQLYCCYMELIKHLHFMHNCVSWII